MKAGKLKTFGLDRMEDIRLTGELTFVADGQFETTGFINMGHTPKLPPGKIFRIGFEKIPTYQNDDFGNLPEYYKSVVYPSEENTLLASGPHYVFNMQSK